MTVWQDAGAHPEARPAPFSKRDPPRSPSGPTCSTGPDGGPMTTGEPVGREMRTGRAAGRRSVAVA
ncbi:hypothetical protein, partial [Microbispora sp. GKU 823]|uniref:hypothetical protein n=1 Tax=Microbispora sp. GKU 823 TaxID=1652100 RepID=UPI001C4E2703